MDNLDEYELAYNKAYNYFLSHNYIKTKKWLEIAKYGDKHKMDIIYMASSIEMNWNNLKEARKIIEENQDFCNNFGPESYALLELLEYNYQKSLNIIINSLDKNNKQAKKLFLLADIYLQLGEYDEAQKIYESLLSKDNYEMATLKLIYLNIIKNNYGYALKLFSKLKENNISKDVYERLKAVLLFLNGKLTKKYRKSQMHFYYVARLVRNDDNDLLNHLKKHVGDAKAEYGSYFFPDIDLEKIIFDVRNIIPNLNPRYDNNSCDYKIIYRKKVGYSNGIKTNSFKVITDLGSGRIITMYPILISSMFNQEGQLENKELMLKRKGK